MKRVLSLCLVLAGAACSAENATMIEIQGRAAPDSVPSCKFAPGGEFVLGTGVLDVGMTTSPMYQLVVYVKNNLADPKATSPEASTQDRAWQAKVARVRIDPQSFVDAFGPNPPLPATQLGNVVPLSGQSIDPAGGTGVLAVEAVSGSLGAQLAALVAANEVKTIVLGVTLEGKTLGGSYVNTGEWIYPVKLCSGCIRDATPTSCPTGQALTPTNCFSSYQDSPPACASSS